MKLFRFRLERVRRVRTIQADACRGQLAAAAMKVEDERQEWECRQGGREQCRQRWLAEMEGQLNLDRVRVYRQEYAVRTWEVQRQAESLADSELEADRKRAELVEAEKRRKVLDRVRERRFLEYRRAEESQDQKRLDEVGSARYHHNLNTERR